MENTEIMENIQNMKNMEIMESIENIVSMENTESMENIQNIDNTQSMVLVLIKWFDNNINLSEAHDIWEMLQLCLLA